MKWLVSKIFHAKFFLDEEEFRKAKLSATLNLVWIGAGTFYSPYYFLIGHIVAAYLVLVAVILLSFNLLFLRKGWLRFQAHGMLFIAMYTLVSIAVTGFGIYDAANAWLASLSLIAFLLLGKKQGVIWLCVNLLAVGLVLFLSQTEFIDLPEAPANLLVYHSFTAFLGVGVFVFFLARVFDANYNRVLNDAHKALEALKHEKQQAEIAKEIAIESSRTKGEFLANMSHEIRTPMNGVLGMADVLRDTQLNEDQQEITDTILSSAESLLRIINDILDISKLEAKKIELISIPFDLRKIIKDLCTIYVEGNGLKKIQTNIEISLDISEVLLGDSDRLKQILTNLIGNAVKFTPAGGTIELKAEIKSETDTQTEVLFSVKDTGIGIPIDKQKKIFEAFTQADGTTTRQFGGTGLGLTISMQLVHLLQGSIWLESEEGVGSTFYFTAIFDKETQHASETEMAFRSFDTTLKS